jgi:hypothetical protein
MKTSTVVWKKKENPEQLFMRSVICTESWAPFIQPVHTQQLLVGVWHGKTKLHMGI